jgi:hypothetical protein
VVGEPGMHARSLYGNRRIGRSLYWTDGPRWEGEEP